MEEEFEQRIQSIKEETQFIFKNDDSYIWAVPIKNMTFPGLQNLQIENTEFIQRFKEYNQKMK